MKPLILAPLSDAASPPNTIVIRTNDPGTGDAGRYSVKNLSTPNIDAIAAHGFCLRRPRPSEGKRAGVAKREFLSFAMAYSRLLLFSAFLGAACVGFAPLTALAEDRKLDFVHDIAPILKQHCSDCHTGAKKKGGFSLNTHSEWLEGSENGAVFNTTAPAKSKVLEVLFSSDPDVLMPPPDKERPRPSEEQLARLKTWVLSGAEWESGYAFKKPAYDAPFKPRLPELPPAVAGRNHPLDRLVDAYRAKNHLPALQLVDDAAFARRIHLDLIGLLPEPEAIDRFVQSKNPDKRAQLADELLQRKTAYTEHWLSFWNDLLRNDYGGTGFITGGRKQISSWLYQALFTNKPYDAMVRELVNPSAQTEGFAQGITWRGTVSASQTQEVQFAQSISQAFLGINLKCASCHDSFIDKWKLTDAYGLAAVYADKPVEIARCEKLTGKTAIAAWPFPEIGQINPSAPRQERLKQLGELMTHPDNGWFARTIANRLWAKLLGRGLVHPVDAMGTLPWSEELLDYLGWDLAQNRYDLKSTLRIIVTSQAYQAQSVARTKDDETGSFIFNGPRAKRLSAETFIDLIWQLTDSAPLTQDAPVRRGEPAPLLIASTTRTAHPIRHSPVPLAAPEKVEGKAGGESPKRSLVAFYKTVELPAKPRRAAGILTGASSVRLIVNGALQQAPRITEQGMTLDLQVEQAFNKGANEIVLLQNASTGNDSYTLLELEFSFDDGSKQRIASDASWKSADGFGEEFVKGGKFTSKKPEFANASWSGVSVHPEGLKEEAARPLLHDFVWAIQPRLPARAALLKADLLMRSLGRPNRDQIVTSRPNDLSTLEALDLSAGKRLSELLAIGAGNIAKRADLSSETLTDWLFLYALARNPQPSEKQAALELLGDKPSPEKIEDLLWTVCMLPEFQLIR